MIELLVVIAIIGVLSTIVLASLNTARAKARDSQRVATVGQIQLALEMYYDSNGKYPATLSLLVPTYLPVEPKDPDGTTSYKYAIYPTSGNITTFHLGTGKNLETVASGTGVLATDKDCNSTSTTCPGGAAYTNGFNGADTIYDLTP